MWPNAKHDFVYIRLSRLVHKDESERLRVLAGGVGPTASARHEIPKTSVRRAGAFITC